MKKHFSVAVYTSDALGIVDENADDNLSYVSIPYSEKRKVEEGFCHEPLEGFLRTCTADTTIGLVQWLKDNGVPYVLK